MDYPFNTSATAKLPKSEIVYVVVRQYLDRFTPIFQSEDYIQALGNAIHNRKTDKSGCKYKIVFKNRIVATKLEGKAIRTNFS